MEVKDFKVSISPREAAEVLEKHMDEDVLGEIQQSCDAHIPCQQSGWGDPCASGGGRRRTRHDFPF